MDITVNGNVPVFQIKTATGDTAGLTKDDRSRTGTPDKQAAAESVRQLPTYIDEITTRRARQGESEAFAAIYDTLKTPAYNLVLRMSCNAQMAEDILHDSFIKVIDKFDSYRGKVPVWAWVRQILVNTTINSIKKESRHENHLELVDSYGRERVAEQQDSSRTQEQQHDALRLLSRLSAKSRTVLILHDIEGMTHTEIADHFKQTESFSKSILFRARKQLQEFINSHDR